MRDNNVYYTDLNVVIYQQKYILHVMYIFVDNDIARTKFPAWPGIAEYIMYDIAGDPNHAIYRYDIDAYLNSDVGIEHLTKQHILNKNKELL